MVGRSAGNEFGHEGARALNEAFQANTTLAVFKLSSEQQDKANAKGPNTTQPARNTTGNK